MGLSATGSSSGIHTVSNCRDPRIFCFQNVAKELQLNFCKRAVWEVRQHPKVRHLVKGLSSLRKTKGKWLRGSEKNIEKRNTSIFLCYHLPYMLLFLLHLLRTGELLWLGAWTGSGQGEVNFLHRCHICNLWLKPLISHQCFDCCEQCWNSTKALSFLPPSSSQGW